MKKLSFIGLIGTYITALIAFVITGWIGWIGIILLILKIVGVIHWSWWIASLPLEYGAVYCLYMTIDGVKYRAGKSAGAYARFTQPFLQQLENENLQIEMENETQLTAGINFDWKYIKFLFMRVNSFIPLARIDVDTVGDSIMGTYGIVTAELPNPDVKPEQRIIKLPILNKSDYKSISRAHTDSGIKNGANELVIIYENRKNLFGGHEASFHVAIYPSGTWNDFYKAVANYKSQEFIWPRPLILYQPSNTNIFPTTKNIFRP